MQGKVVSLARSADHSFSKEPISGLNLIAGHGVEDDAHAGTTVKHRSRVAVDPTQPNLRQVHLIHQELLAQLGTSGFEVKPSQLGENITTSGIDLLDLPRGTLLRIGNEAVVQITGLRNPCKQIDGFQNGLLKQLAHREADGSITRLAGIMGVVLTSGAIAIDDAIVSELPEGPPEQLKPV